MKQLFDFEQIYNFKCGGVYTIYKVDPNGYEEVVKYGESEFILKRLSNYLTEFKSKKEELKANRSTKRRVLDGIKKYKKDGCLFYVDWIVENNSEAREILEKSLIEKFFLENKRLPIFHQVKK